ncbi:MAG: hypothetical protein CVV24_04015 [Ignavibacteriae bacterium HGW-Ignavibacteriae-3]|nr:MAG: hypothetical protein CVV24_04015 [Ignavibacteriae bacterium HGW-Ignavibacteriae-3]
MKKIWHKIPEQVKRLSVLLIVIVAVFIVANSLLTPKDFGLVGHYRAGSIQENADRELKYAGQEACADCHDDLWKLKNANYHKNLSCEVCHGPSINHTNDPDQFKPEIPRDRTFCVVCHEYNTSRPTGYPQIVSEAHNPRKICVTCHNPHNPTPPQAPKECSACHAEISSVKSVSSHMDIPCTKCHVTTEKHRLHPREFRPTKPVDREFCGQCHSQSAKADKFIPRINMVTHEPRYVCWQCHYPHLPEAQ